MELLGEPTFWKGIASTLIVSFLFYRLHHVIGRLSVRFYRTKPSKTKGKLFDATITSILHLKSFFNIIFGFVIFKPFTQRVLSTNGLVLVILCFVALNFLLLSIPEHRKIKNSVSSRLFFFLDSNAYLARFLSWDISQYTMACLAVVAFNGSFTLSSELPAFVVPPGARIALTSCIVFIATLIISFISQKVHREFLIQQENYNGPTQAWETIEAIRRYIANELPSDQSPERVYQGRGW